MEDGLIERNWAGNVTFRAAHIHRPHSIDEVRASVADAARDGRRVHAVGSRHSFSTIADTDGDLVSMMGLDRIVEIDRNAMTVTVEAGIRFGELAVALHQSGLALHNLPSLPHITIGGAVATGTHGSGMTNPSMSAVVTAVELIDASAELVQLSRNDDPDRFPGAVVNLGVLGIVARLTVAIEPTFEVAQVLYRDLPIELGLDHLDDVLGSAYSVSLFTDWQRDVFQQVWCKYRIAGHRTPTPEVQSELPAELFGAASADRPMHMIESLSAESCTQQLGVPGPWHERLPHFRLAFSPSLGDELQTEYFVDRANAVGALRAMHGLRDLVAPLLLACEVRAVAGDDLWLSPVYGRDSLAIHLTWMPDQPAVMALLQQVEAVLAPFDARPHLGKLTAMTPETIRARTPRFGDFVDLVDDLDPAGMFSNEAFARLRA